MSRNELPSSLKIVTVWLLIGLALFLGFKAFEQRGQRARIAVEGDVVEIQRSADGHYHWPGRINGRKVDFLIDTGATSTAISTTLARELDLPVLGEVQGGTANGPVVGQVVQADLSLQGGVKAERLHLTALPHLDGHPLLGMDVLGKLRWKQHDGVLSIDLRPDR
jgi:aspartyl protease family protein